MTAKPLPLPPDASLARGDGSNLRGMLWMLGSAVCFTAMAGLLKVLAKQGFSEAEMIFFRAAAGFVVLAPVAVVGGWRRWAVRRPWQVLLRCLFSTVGFFASFYAFVHLPLAQAQAITFSRTLFVVVLAALLLHEAVGWRRWAAVAVGFVGVLVMTRPSSASFDLATLAALAASFFFALAIVTVKDLTRDHSTLTLVLWTNAFTTLVGLPFALGDWVTPGWLDLLLLLGLGLAGVGAQSCYVRALSHGEASVLGLVDYVRLPLAVVMGFALFAEQPDRLTLIGAAVVVGATGYIAWREGGKKIRRVPVEPAT